MPDTRQQPNDFTHPVQNDTLIDNALSTVSIASVISFGILTMLCIAFVIYGIYLCFHPIKANAAESSTMVSRVSSLEQKCFTSEEYQQKHASHTEFSKVNLDEFLKNVAIDPEAMATGYVGKTVELSFGTISEIGKDSITIQVPTSSSLLKSEPISSNDASVFQNLQELSKGEKVIIWGTITRIDKDKHAAYIDVDKLEPVDAS